MPRIRWPWTRELEVAKKAVTEAVEHREQAERQAAAVVPMADRVTKRGDLNGFSHTYVIRKVGRHA